MDNNIEISVMKDLQNLPIIKKLYNSQNELDARLNIQVPSSYISQYLVCMHIMEIINEKLPFLESYKKAIHRFGLGSKNSLNREVYSSVVLRLWIILNKLNDPIYELSLEFVDPIVDKTINKIKDDNFNYFIEPLLLPLNLLENIIKYSNDKISRFWMEWYLESNFIQNSQYIINIWSQWIKASQSPDKFNNIYMIEPYLLMLKDNPKILKSSLVIDLDILKKLDSDIFQKTLSIKHSIKKDEKQELEINFKKINLLAKNMNRILINYFTQIGGLLKNLNKTKKRKNKRKNKRKKSIKKKNLQRVKKT